MPWDPVLKLDLLNESDEWDACELWKTHTILRIWNTIESRMKRDGHKFWCGIESVI